MCRTRLVSAEWNLAGGGGAGKVGGCWFGSSRCSSVLLHVVDAVEHPSHEGEDNDPRDEGSNELAHIFGPPWPVTRPWSISQNGPLVNMFGL